MYIHLTCNLIHHLYQYMNKQILRNKYNIVSVYVHVHVMHNIKSQELPMKTLWKNKQLDVSQQKKNSCTFDQSLFIPSVTAHICTRIDTYGYIINSYTWRDDHINVLNIQCKFFCTKSTNIIII